MEPLALKKYINLCEYLALYPEFQCIFIGDNGQGDVRTGVIEPFSTYQLDLIQLCSGNDVGYA